MIELPFSRVYDPPSHCLYCPAKSNEDGTRLSREHIIPLGLSGELILRQASCGVCAKLINQEIERDLLQTMYIQPRVHLKMRSRGKNKPLTTLQFGVFNTPAPGTSPNMDNANFEWLHVPVEKHAFVIVMVKYAVPGLLQGAAPVTTFQPKRMTSYYGYFQLPPLPVGRTAGIFQKTNPSVEFRFIAKIAHGAAVAELGADAFEPFLPPVILGSDPHPSHYIGGSASEHPTEALHWIGLEQRGEYLIALVQLFGKFGFRPWQAVVGKLRRSLA